MQHKVGPKQYFTTTIPITTALAVIGAVKELDCLSTLA
jgi:hypothetical protein